LVVSMLSSNPAPVVTGSQPGARMAEQEPTESVLSSLLRRGAGLARRMTGAGYPDKLQRRLDIAGNPAKWPVSRVLALKGVGVVAGVLVGGLYGIKIGGMATLLVPGGLAAAGFFLPDVWIRNLGEHRQIELRNGLPDVIDMMTVCVEAGLGFDGAVARMAANLNTPAAAEFSRVLQEMQIGKSRVEALRDAADRTDVSEFRTFITSVVQSSELGISIGDVLRAQATQMRIKRRQRAEEAAQKLPVKILAPLVVCILPAMFVVILGPAILSITQMFGKG
jgi:tight adherence protein C